MWMDTLCKRRALSFPKHTHSGRARLLCFNHFDKILQQEEPLKQPIHNQNTAFTPDTNFCPCCHKYRYRSRRTIRISRRLFISLTNSANPITLLIIFSLLTNSCYANAQSPPKTTAVTQTPGPGVPSSPYVSLDEEKYKTLETQPQSRTIPGAPYYEFFINEASYKFWAVFQLTTVFILLYSAFAAIYYAKYTFLTEIETLKDEDIILRRRRQLSSEAAHQIIKATASLSLPLEDRRLPN